MNPVIICAFLRVTNLPGQIIIFNFQKYLCRHVENVKNKLFTIQDYKRPLGRIYFFQISY
uniref:Uncharacterized protein n=1 Tax=Anguilla anguilla TaxID=7936 RepID=A0A0E9P5W2_ANGAN